MVRDNRTRRFVMTMIVLAAALAVLAMLNLSMGSTNIPPRQVLSALFGSSSRGGAADMAYSIVHEIRLPRVIAAIMLGGALAVSGFLLQTFFGNPIAGPYILGISSGSKLTVALAMVFLLQQGITMNSAGMAVAAFAGALLATGFVILIAGRVNNMSVLVVCGIMIGYICSALTNIVVTFADDSNIVNLHNWSLGSLSGISMENVKILTVITAAAMLAAFLMSKPMSAYQLGEAYARSMGVNIRALRVELILVSSLLSACVTAFAGPISFVGVAVPHLVRGMSGTAKPILLIPGCFLCGAAVTLLCDGIARMLFAPTELSISSVTAVFLVPVVIYIMLRRKK